MTIYSAHRIRWSDNDHYLGPFTYARERGPYRSLSVMLGSGDGDDYPGCRLRLSGFGHTLIIALPAVIKPHRRWVDTSRHSWASAGGGYWDVSEREYGFTVAEDYLHVHHGAQTNDSTSDHSWCLGLPWKQWRHVRHELYGLDGESFSIMPERARGASLNWQAREALQAACPKREFAFADFDGEPLVATTRIEEREWRLGEGWFRWLGWFCPPKISRSLDITFSGETGERKGSWKGGTIGHSIEMLPRELHEEAFRRYCAEHKMTFLAPPVAA
ncbi:MAG: hypothetical protein DI629_12190 [Mesorhizobium amorphae]|nr:MAG: hypothetical protein DI629_12190 [Mesorhizobium amorphae]